MNRLKHTTLPVVQHPLPLLNKIDVNLGAVHMKPLSWVRFSWDLTKLSESAANPPNHYRIEPAVAEDAFELRKVFSSAFMLDPVWSPAIGQVMQRVQGWLDLAFGDGNRVCLALRHGSRIVGAALLSLDAKVENHLIPGPCVLTEYRNRELGTLLLEQCLHHLRDRGLANAAGISRDISTAAKFLYPKFGGVSAPCEVSTLAAA